MESNNNNSALPNFLTTDINSRIKDGNLKKFYDTLMGKTKTRSCGHNLLLSQNLQSNKIDTAFDDLIYTPFPLNSTLPVPFSKPLSISSDDTNLQYIKEKEKWKYKVRLMKSSYKIIPKHRKMDTFNSKSSSAVVPLYLLKFAKLLKNDPDPYFDSYYNWYFNGNGNICTMKFENETYILRSVNNTIYIHRLFEDFHDHEEVKYSLNNDNLIHETKFKIFSSKCLIGVRQKLNIHLFNFERKNNNVILELFKTINSHVPFTSFEIDENLDGIYYTCVNGTVFLCNFNSEKSVEIYSHSSDEKLVNCWSSIQLLDQNNIIQTNYDTIHIFDKRKQNVIGISNTISKFMDCEKMTSSKLSIMNPNYIFTGSTHSVQLYDLRCISNPKNVYIKNWTHGLKFQPSYMFNELIDKSELILISSQNMNESCLVLNQNNFDINDKAQDDSQKNFDKYKHILPWHPPTLNDSLKIVQQKGYCLDPTINVKKRIDTSRTGVGLIPGNGEINILTLNSLGDSFHQKLSFDDSKDYESLSKSFNDWATQLNTNSAFTFTSNVDMTKHYNIMRRRNRPNFNRRKCKKLLMSDPVWRNKLKDMFECTDLCAHELLSVWELNAEDFGVESVIPPPLDTTFNINTWMNQFDDL